MTEPIEFGRRVAHTLHLGAPMGYDPVDERIEIDLLEDGPVTVVRFRHDGDFGAGARAGHVEGWGNVLGTLQKLVESP